jgi:hypothetical protein
MALTVPRTSSLVRLQQAREQQFGTPYQDDRQALRLQVRGDFGNSKLRFEATLPKAFIMAESALQTLGLEVELLRSMPQLPSPSSRPSTPQAPSAPLAGAAPIIMISKVALKRLGVCTPIGIWNFKQERLRQPDLVIRPGDRVCAVNTSNEDFNDIIKELTSGNQVVKVIIERSMDFVLQPTGQAPLKLEVMPMCIPGVGRYKFKVAGTAVRIATGSKAHMRLERRVTTGDIPPKDNEAVQDSFHLSGSLSSRSVVHFDERPEDSQRANNQSLRSASTPSISLSKVPANSGPSLQRHAWAKDSSSSLTRNFKKDRGLNPNFLQLPSMQMQQSPVTSARKPCTSTH